MEPVWPEEAITLGPWRVEPRRRRIAHGDHEVRLEPRVMQTLVCLARKAGATLTREELMQAVWGHTHISEDALNRTVSQLRKAFQHGSRVAVLIETVPRVGYRLVVVGADTAETAAAPAETETLEAPLPPSSIVKADRIGKRRLFAATALVLIALTTAWVARSDRTPETPPVALEIRPLTSYPGQELEASYSPDGTQIVFVWDGGEPAGPARHSQLYVRPVGADTPMRITEGSGIRLDPAWSPDGSRIAYRHLDNGSCSIMLVSPTGGPLRKVTACGFGFGGDSALSWSPDGRWLAYVPPTSVDSFYDAAIIDIETGKPVPLSSPPKIAGPKTYGTVLPTFSPDGQELALLRWRSGAVTDIYLRSLLSGEERRLTEGNIGISAIAWEPDGRHLIYASGRGGFYSLWRVGRDGGTPQRLSLPGYDISSVAIHPSSQQLIYQETDRRIALYSRRIDGSDPPRVLLRSTRSDWQARVSPDGSRLAFISTRSGAAEVWISNLDGSRPQQLTRLDPSGMSRPTWSRDGERIYFDSVNGENMDLYVIDVGGGPARRLTDDTAEDRFSQTSRDGHWLYFSSTRSGSWQVWKMPAAGGTPVQLTREGGFLAQESEDGRWLYYTRRGQRGLWRQPVAGGAAEQVLDASAGNDDVAWLLHGNRALMVTAAADGSAWLGELDLANRELLLRVPLPRRVGWSGLEATADGNIIYAGDDHEEADLVVVDRYLGAIAPPA